MIYLVKAKKADYEQVCRVVLSAPSKERALILARKEFDLAKNWVFPWKEQELIVERIDINKEDIIATVMV